jgi:hypothetical protein
MANLILANQCDSPAAFHWLAFDFVIPEALVNLKWSCIRNPEYSSPRFIINSRSQSSLSQQPRSGHGFLGKHGLYLWACDFFGLFTSAPRTPLWLRKGNEETLHPIFQSEADSRPVWRAFRALIAVRLVVDLKPLLFRFALTIERICSVTCAAGFTSKISRPLGTVVDSVLTDISASSALAGRRSESLPPLESVRRCLQ